MLPNKIVVSDTDSNPLRHYGNISFPIFSFKKLSLRKYTLKSMNSKHSLIQIVGLIRASPVIEKHLLQIRGIHLTKVITRPKI